MIELILRVVYYISTKQQGGEGVSDLGTAYGEKEKYIDVYLDGGAHGAMSGLLAHRSSERAWRFGSLVELISVLEALFAEPGFPQQTHELKGAASSAGEPARQAETPLDRQPDFTLKIRYRQNATWQGTISRAGQKDELRFRSLLELVRILS